MYQYVQFCQKHVFCSESQRAEIEALGVGFLFEGSPEPIEAPNGDLEQLSALGNLGYHVVDVHNYRNGRCLFTLEREVSQNISPSLEDNTPIVESQDPELAEGEIE